MIMEIVIFLLGMKIIILLLGKWLRVWGSEYVGGFKSTGVDAPVGLLLYLPMVLGCESIYRFIKTFDILYLYIKHT
ncbi:hypothetical protein HanRHA438_Chr13g0607151 [Helianthus annuus]|uniref:Uncharacterized protein n=1 Tax=Helianthus annuus TaxID=4232 RepID=A0A9K3EIY8_HELAN|nr:hypothetical protein HanXRQr2_Chr13g0596461 [Helianthus annuus]KAJ0481988.1 hypothetical protein HanIR_Chr13g0648881 [Helianthus annuus]KAJ0849913.1 hypothetical protein HanPSC8_Chr13g0574421 [Helianthus annuus]KAJ0858971.1 hypothetical protein HanRHA438_Chr13g0607151 [Helianthus annuus]